MSSNRLSFLGTLLASHAAVFPLCAAWSAEPAAPVAVGRPSIILCMTDDQGWGDTGYNGLTKIKTPAIDSMAAGGLRFDRFYAAAPVCSPTRASVLSGRHPFRSGIFRAGDPWRTEELSIAEALKPAGYTTVHFGKWHLNGVGGPGKPVSGDDPLSPGKFGFDEWFSVSNFFDLDCTFGHNGTPVNTTGDGSDVIVAQALKWIEAQSKVGKPFLAVVWFGSPHVPHKPTDADLQTAGGDAYYGEIIGIDRAMGTLRAGLRKLGVAGNTMLWFNSDNGGDTKSSVGVFRGRKRGLYEGGLRVPGILEWPSRIKPAKTSVPVCTSDLYPTILEAAGVSVPNQVLPLDGISLMPLLEGKMAERPRPIGFWFGAERQTGTEPQAGGHAAWSDNRYKLHKISATNFILYDLIDDPSERKDIAKDKPELVTKMKSELDAWQGSVVKSLRGEDYKAGK